MKREIRFPTILGLFALLFGVAVGVWLIGSRRLLFLRADVTEQPAYVSITNVSDTGFSVSWTSSKATTGTIRYGTSANDLTTGLADDRDQASGTVSPYTTHHITVGKLRPLSPLTEYFFVIQSGGSVYDDGGRPYSVRTGPILRGQPGSSDAISGKVVSTDGTPATGAIVYFSLAGVTPLSSLVTTTGNWVIPLTLARSSDLAKIAVYDRQASVAEIFVQARQTARASIVLANARPVPTMVLGQTYDWRTPLSGQPNQPTSPPVAASPLPSPFVPRSGFMLSPLASPPSVPREVTIVSPAADESVNTTRPAIVGTGPRGTELSVTIESASKLFGTVTIRADGTWEWAVPDDLSPGEHTATVTYTDLLGNLQKIARHFTVLASDSSLPAFVSTPSATSTPEPTESPLPSPTAPPRVSVPSTDSGVPESGNIIPTFGLAIMGLVFLLLGFIPLLVKGQQHERRQE